MTTPTHYKRYECILACEGPIDPGKLHGELTAHKYRYHNVPEDEIVGHLVLLSHVDLPIRVDNGLAHVSQRALRVYRSASTVTERDIARLKENDKWVVDFVGRFDVVRDENGTAVGRNIIGRLTHDMSDGEIMFVRPSVPHEPKEVEFVISSFSSSPPRIVSRPFMPDE